MTPLLVPTSNGQSTSEVVTNVRASPSGSFATIVPTADPCGQLPAGTELAELGVL